MKKRGRPFGTKDLTKRVRSHNISPGTKHMVELHLLKLLSLEQDYNLWTVNEDICALFTMTQAYDKWMDERGIEPLNKKLNEWLRKLRSALDDSFLFLFPFSDEFKQMCNTEQILVLENLAAAFKKWILEGALPDFFLTYKSGKHHQAVEKEQELFVQFSISSQQQCFCSDDEAGVDLEVNEDEMNHSGKVNWYKQMRPFLILKGKEKLIEFKMTSQRGNSNISTPLFLSLSRTSRLEEEEEDSSNNQFLLRQVKAYEEEGEDSNDSSSSNSSSSSHSGPLVSHGAKRILVAVGNKGKQLFSSSHPSNSTRNSGDDDCHSGTKDVGWCGLFHNDDVRCRKIRRKNEVDDPRINQQTLFIAQNNMLQSMVDYRIKEWDHLKKEVEKQLHQKNDGQREDNPMNDKITEIFNKQKDVLGDVMLYGQFIEALVSMLDVLKEKRRRFTRELPDDLLRMVENIAMIDTDDQQVTNTMKMIVSSVVPNVVDKMCQTMDSRLHSALPPHVFVSLQDYILSGNRYPSMSAMTVLTGVNKPTAM